jgi:complex iron-sulfur molybdoenzyme family reductase subunit alpha
MGRNTHTFPKGYIALENLDPALEGKFQVKLQDGNTVEVRPVFEILKSRIEADNNIAKAAKITGVPAKTIIEVAREYATTQPAMIICGGGTQHWYYSDVLLRAMHLLTALVGSEGKNGGGMNHYIGQWKPVFLPGVAARLPRRPCEATVLPDDDLDLHPCRS